MVSHRAFAAHKYMSTDSLGKEKALTFTWIVLSPFQDLADERRGVAAGIYVGEHQSDLRWQLEGFGSVVPAWIAW